MSRIRAGGGDLCSIIVSCWCFSQAGAESAMNSCWQCGGVPEEQCMFLLHARPASNNYREVAMLHHHTDLRESWCVRTLFLTRLGGFEAFLQGVLQWEQQLLCRVSA